MRLHFEVEVFHLHSISIGVVAGMLVGRDIIQSSNELQQVIVLIVQFHVIDHACKSQLLGVHVNHDDSEVIFVARLDISVTS